MRKNIIEFLALKIFEETGLNVGFEEPDFENPAVFPAAWIEIEEEGPREGLQQPFKRNLFLSLYIVDRALEKEVSKKFLGLLLNVDAIDRFVLANRNLDFEGKILQLKFLSFSEQTVRALKNDFCLIGVKVKLQITYDMEV